MPVVRTPNSLETLSGCEQGWQRSSIAPLLPTDLSQEGPKPAAAPGVLSGTRAPAALVFSPSWLNIGSDDPNAYE